MLPAGQGGTGELKPRFFEALNTRLSNCGGRLAGNKPTSSDVRTTSG